MCRQSLRVLRRQPAALTHVLQQRLIQHVQDTHARQDVRGQAVEYLDQRRYRMDENQQLRHHYSTTNWRR